MTRDKPKVKIQVCHSCDLDQCCLKANKKTWYKQLKIPQLRNSINLKVLKKLRNRIRERSIREDIAKKITTLLFHILESMLLMS